jgi:hypothetical protein
LEANEVLAGGNLNGKYLPLTAAWAKSRRVWEKIRMESRRGFEVMQHGCYFCAGFEQTRSVFFT